MKYLHKYLLLLIPCLCFFACSKDSEPDINEPSTNRTLLIYMVATNSLGNYGFDEKDLKEIDQAIQNYDIANNRVLVYRTSYFSTPQLFEVLKENGNVIHKTLKTYSKDESSVSSNRMSDVFNDVKTLSKSNDYGLILWSHSDGWARSLTQTKSNVTQIDFRKLTRDFGNDYGRGIAIDELANVIPNDMFSFIYSDVCYMGSIEVAYQLRNKTKYFIGSPTVLPANGMPYDKNIPLFLKETPALKQACENTFLYYDSLNGIDKTITISLIDCSKLDKIATICKEINNSSTINVNIETLQKYISPKSLNCIYFDFAQYYRLRATEEQLTKFNSLMPDLVIYKANTNSIFGEFEIDSDNFSGLSSYILGTSSTTNEEYYHTLYWYNSVYN